MTLKQEDRVRQSILLLNSTLKITTVGRCSRTEKQNALFSGQQAFQLTDYLLYLIWRISSVTHSLQPQENVLSISILEALLLSVRKQEEIPSPCVLSKWWLDFLKTSSLLGKGRKNGMPVSPREKKSMVCR